MKIFIGADHRGFELKEELKDFLKELEYSVEDLGAHTLDPNDDYPVYAKKVAEAVLEAGKEKSKIVRGIVICGSGVGVDIVANKIDGIRAGLGINAEQIESARRDDDINVLSIAANQTSISNAREMVKAFIDTEFDTAERRARRLKAIDDIEKK
ncbi:MAG TPA: RpiB/LacA/LacB family sugar-phosphate isomerase [Patescibacteria group bacterium]|nr:RpiB/LacA/LacB family sugar-phosphate isomerase [Patescibacteria group bacterium]